MPTPLEDRWETLEDCERAVRSAGRAVLSSAHLSLIRVGRGELVRVGRPLRTELAGWRYGDRLPPPRREGVFRSLLGRLPPPPPHGYRPYGLGRADPPAHWVLSPFQDSAWALTTAFANVPLTDSCPSCGGPLAVRPWEFHLLRFVPSGGRPHVVATCALCDRQVALELVDVRPAVRLGLAAVGPGTIRTALAEAAARELDRSGGREAFLEGLAEEGATLGDLHLEERMALTIALDEMAELEALEQEWRAAEEIAAIMDGELTDVRGFEAFRQSVLAAGRRTGL